MFFQIKKGYDMMTLTSTSLNDGQMIPKHFVFDGMGCNGDNISPELEWQGAPAGTRSFALTMYDPDAPTDHGWWHWTVVNIPMDVHRLPEGASNEKSLPTGAIELSTDYKKKGYGGPCPPIGSGPHRYVFTIYALDEERINVNQNQTAETFKKVLEEHSLAEASFTTIYER